MDKLYIDDFGDCKGTGRCGSCLIRTLNQRYGPADYERNEQTTLSRSGITAGTFRLSCQLLINDAIDGLEFEVIEPA